MFRPDYSRPLPCPNMKPDQTCDACRGSRACIVPRKFEMVPINPVSAPEAAQAVDAMPGWFEGVEDCDGNPLVTLHADDLRAAAKFMMLPALASTRIDGDMVTRAELAERLAASPASTAPAAQAVTASSYPCFGVFRQQDDENNGEEFFYCALWHNDTNWGEGHRVVEGAFAPASTPEAAPAYEIESRWVALLEAANAYLALDVDPGIMIGLADKQTFLGLGTKAQLALMCDGRSGAQIERDAAHAQQPAAHADELRNVLEMARNNIQLGRSLKARDGINTALRLLAASAPATDQGTQQAALADIEVRIRRILIKHFGWLGVGKGENSWEDDVKAICADLAAIAGAPADADVAKDAARYDWLRMGKPYRIVCTNSAGKPVTYMVAPRNEHDHGNALDAAIDAAMSMSASHAGDKA